MRIDWIGRLLLLAAVVSAAIFLWAENGFSPSFEKCVSSPFGKQASKSAVPPADSLFARIRDEIGPQTICTIRLVDRHNGFFAVLTGFLVAIFTFTLWRSTDRMWLAALDQGEQTRASIQEATRASNAMERVAASLDINAQQIVETVKINRGIANTNKRNSESQQRAYVSALTGNAVYQERDKGWKFEAKPALKNFGWTPGRKVRWCARAAILPVPLPSDFKFTLPNAMNGPFPIPPQQTVTINALVDDFVDDAEIENIMTCNGKSLYVWGLVTYRDVFGHFRRLTFNHQVYWYKDSEGKLRCTGTWLQRHNVAS